MMLIREFEEMLHEKWTEGAIPTTAIHLSTGQEAVAAGVCMNLRTTDYLNTTHRGHGHIIAKGADLNGMMAEIYGKASGLCAGKGGSMHIADLELGIIGANGIVGAGIPIAVGAAIALDNTNKKNHKLTIQIRQYSMNMKIMALQSVLVSW